MHLENGWHFEGLELKADCGNFKFQILKMKLYDEPKGQGKVLDEFDLKDEWVDSEAKSAGEPVLKFVCKS